MERECMESKCMESKCMEKITVELGDRSYPIYTATDFSGLGSALGETGPGSRVMIVTDSNVSRLYLETCMDELASAGTSVCSHVFEAGEKSKHLDTVKDIYRELAAQHFDRNSAIAALGGGVTGDIAGFAAATYMRGISYIQIPTTLLAQADSSIGGKTGVDFEGVKNMVGAFYQPRFVYININTLRTLPLRELRSGLAEVIKHGLIMDAGLYDYIRLNMRKIFEFDESTLLYIAKANCNIKRSVVEQDEKEGGLRAILNLGHTIGHAVESVSGFELLHGECVSIGTAGVFRLAWKLGSVSRDIMEEVEQTLKAAGLPVRAPGMDPRRIYTEMLHDKKVKGGKLNFVLPESIGKVTVCSIDDGKPLMDVLEELTA